MYVGRKLLSSFIVFICLVFSVAGAAADGSPQLAEEGWRYQGTLRVKLAYDNAKPLVVDFSAEHYSMAHMIRATADAGQYSSMLRFTSVFLNNSDLTVGPTVCLKPIECLQLPLPSYEVAFASGTSRADQERSMKCSVDSVSIELASTESVEPIVKKDIMTLRAARHSIGSGKEKEYRSNTYPVRFMVANKVERDLLELQLSFRYKTMPQNSIILKGNNNLVIKHHIKILDRLATQKDEALKEKAMAEHMSNIVLKLGEKHKEIEGLTNPAGEISPDPNTSANMIEGKLTKLSEIYKDCTNCISTQTRNWKDLVETPNTCAEANSYSCAEQANLNYLYDHRVIKYLQTSLDVENNNFIGLIVHAHCSHTPCHTCATSFTRESEHDGVLSRLVNNNKKVIFLCSCAEHYKRPEVMLQYETTSFAQDLLTDGIKTIDLSSKDPSLPYPIVKLTYDENGRNHWSIDQHFLDGIKNSVAPKSPQGEVGTVE